MPLYLPWLRDQNGMASLFLEWGMARSAHRAIRGVIPHGWAFYATAGEMALKRRF